ncbi:hypothetical protein [Promicromonospora sp. MEB111]|uniref:hypothetical protein n=1 Tax=Promicromonospora sp. MEB111 TaxID=3040301 RepID=UPI00254E3DAA|nr:hypothetical protein [Promicromonospora sp. MEB111]
MTVETHVVTATIDPGGLNLSAPIESGPLTMDAGWSPYTQGTIVVPMDVGDLSGYLPGTVLRVRITASAVEDPANTQTWEVHARHIRKDRLAGTYTIQVSSDEALIVDWGARMSSLAFASPGPLGSICNDVLIETLGTDGDGVGADAPFLEIDDHLRVWPAGMPAWDYLSTICNSLDGRILFQEPDGTWSIRKNSTTWDAAPVGIPAPDDALSYVEEWSRESDYANAVTVEFTGGDPGYTTIAVPGSDPAVSVQVPIRRYGNFWLPTSSSVKPALAKAYDTSTTVTRDHPEARRDLYAEYVEHRRRNLGYFLTWRTVSHYGLQPRQAIGDTEMFVDRVTHDLGTNEMTVSAHLPYTGEPV